MEVEARKRMHQEAADGPLTRPNGESRVPLPLKCFGQQRESAPKCEAVMERRGRARARWNHVHDPVMDVGVLGTRQIGGFQHRKVKPGWDCDLTAEGPGRCPKLNRAVAQ